MQLTVIPEAPSAQTLPEPVHKMFNLLGVPQSIRIAGQGPACVVHPGGPGIDWTYLRMPALEAHLTMIYVEPIGTGASGRLASHPAGYTVERYSAQLSRLLDALGLEQVFLLGHSHGGFVSQQFALDHPDRLKGLILYSSAAVTGADFMAAAAQEVASFAARHADDAIAADVQAAWSGLGTMASDTDYETLLRRLLPVYFADYRHSKGRFEALRDHLKATLVIGDTAPFDVRDRIGDLTIPTLLLVGQHDFICGPRHGDLLASLLSRARLEHFAQSGHFIHLEQPNSFEEAVMSFVTHSTALSGLVLSGPE